MSHNPLLVGENKLRIFEIQNSQIYQTLTWSLSWVSGGKTCDLALGTLVWGYMELPAAKAMIKGAN